MKRYGWRFFAWLVFGLPVPAAAQALVGDGLKGDYYSGHNFERYVLTRRDATIDFDWQQASPALGLPAEEFSVRWTGWLVPPASGHYVLHVRVDDGMRLWLNGRQLLDEWRGQQLSLYEVAVDLQAGVAYPLRVDYCQYSYSSRALLTWERPHQAAPNSWRNLWGVAAASPTPEAIPTRYLFSRSPVAPVVTAPKPAVLPAKEIPKASAPKPKLPVPHQAHAPVVAVRPRPVRALPVTPPKPTAAALPDSGRATTVAARLAEGRAVTLPALYFEQGKAYLLPRVQASLDTLATALRQRPTLRLEVQGHTDNQGDAALNRQLSQQRAEAVCRYLTTSGIAAERLRPVGYGGSQPIADNRDLTQRPRNRRVVLQPLP